MKHSFVQMLFFIFLFSSCTENVVTIEKAQQPISQERNRSEILSIAKNAPAMFISEEATRNASICHKTIDSLSMKAVHPKTRTSSVNNSIYVINYVNDEGYVMVSAKEGTPGVIAYIDEGHYDLEEINDVNTDIGMVTDMATAYLSSVGPLEPVNPINPRDTMRVSVGPFITVKWGQHNNQF